MQLRQLVAVLAVMASLAAAGQMRVRADVQELWVRTYAGPVMYGQDDATKIVLDVAGNVYVAGSSTGPSGYDMTAVKYDPDGNLVRVIRYNGPFNRGDYLMGLSVDAAGNLYMCGYTEVPGFPGSTWDAITVKYDPNGNLVWAKRYNGPGNNDDRAMAMVVDSAGNVYVTGDSYGGFAPGFEYVTIKYDSAGNQQWVQRYNNGLFHGSNRATAIALDSAGNVCVCGETISAANSRDATIVKYTPNGSLTWVQTYSDPATQFVRARVIKVDSSDSILVAGQVGDDGNDQFGTADFLTLKYSPSGALLWRRTYL